ncbi:MAG TPA: hypothetical protein PKE16_13515 [Hyphomicrobium sp.]|nr:hypothetical protein [Hyphomicrobium sp.]
MFDDSLGPLLQRVQALVTPAPGGWGTTVTPEGGTTQPVNAGGIGDAFMANLKQANPAQAIGKAALSAMQQKPQNAPSMPAGAPVDNQAQMGRAGMDALKAMARPVASSPIVGSTPTSSPGRSPFMMAPRSIYGGSK